MSKGAGFNNYRQIKKFVCNYAEKGASYKALIFSRIIADALVKDGLWISSRAGSFITIEVALEILSIRNRNSSLLTVFLRSSLDSTLLLKFPAGKKR
ncbi:MAG TPA: hypothetical protein VF556_05550 [Pyrinomonadaceae bacterium]